MLVARQSTARTVTVGPVLDADGVAVTNGVVGDFKISKNGGAPAALNGSATLTHRHTGHYSLALTASDLDTVGTAEVVIDDTVNACPMKEISVIEEAVYDALFAASAPGYLQPTTAGRTLDVTATGAAGIDWGNVENPSADVNLSATIVGTVEAVTFVNSANVTQFGGTAGTFAGGRPEVNLTHWRGTQPDTLNGTKVRADVWAWLGDTPSGLSVGLVQATIGSATVNANVIAISGDSTAADNAEAFFDGTGYAGTNNVIPTVTTVTNPVTITGDAATAGTRFLTMIELDGAVYRYTANALEQGPAGGGGSAAAVWEYTVEGAFTAEQLLRGIASFAMGKANGGRTTTVNFRNLGDTKNRIVATVDSDGNRTAVTRDLT